MLDIFQAMLAAYIAVRSRRYRVFFPVLVLYGFGGRIEFDAWNFLTKVACLSELLRLYRNLVLDTVNEYDVDDVALSLRA